MPPASEKVSVTLDPELLAEARRFAGPNLSAWIAQAVHHRLLLERGREFIREVEGEDGPIPAALRKEVRHRWRDSPSTPGP